MLTPVAAGSTVTPLHHRRRHAGERLPVRVDPRRDLVPDEEQEQARPVREPRDVARPVPVHAVGADRGELTERLRQLAAQPPRGRPRHGRDPLRRARDRERRELPAVLLELPRRRGERLRQAAALHERGGDRLGQAHGLRVPGDDRCGRRTPDRRRRRPRPEERQDDADLGHGPAQPREQPRRAGLRPSRRPLGRRLVCERPGAVAGLQLHRRRLEGRLARRGRPLGVRLRHARDQRLRRHRPRLEPAAHGSLRQGPEEHRHRTQPGRHRPDGRRRRLSAAAEHRVADRPNGVGIDGPQWVLEHWSDLNDVFQFTRIEDMAYDKRPGMQNVVYLADSGRGTAVTGRSSRGRACRRTGGSGGCSSTRATRRR